MNDSLANFESQLQQLSPANCDDLAGDTFYRAGWEACTAKLSTKVRAADNNRAPVRKQLIGTFATGLFCGMLCSAGIVLWNVTATSDGNGRIIAEQSESPPAVARHEPTAKHRVKLTATPVPGMQRPARTAKPQQNGHDQFGLIAFLMPWPGIQPPLEPPSNDVAEPLSAAARNSWSQVVVADPKPWNGITATNLVDQPSTLRTFPTTEAILQELL